MLISSAALRSVIEPRWPASQWEVPTIMNIDVKNPSSFSAGSAYLISCCCKFQAANSASVWRMKMELVDIVLPFSHSLSGISGFPW